MIKKTIEIFSVIEELVQHNQNHLYFPTILQQVICGMAKRTDVEARLSGLIYALAPPPNRLCDICEISLFLQVSVSSL